MRGAVAGGHPLTAEAGARVLAEGGNAVDACIAAAFASAVTESPLTGPGSGGFMLIHRARDRSTRIADFFVTTPGLGLDHLRGGAMKTVDVGFGGDNETKQLFRIGEASCAVPGTILGLATTHKAFGKLPWAELVAPAIEFARAGVVLSREQAHLQLLLDPILRLTDEGRKIYSPHGNRFVAGQTMAFNDLADTLEAIQKEGAAAFYRGERAHAMVTTIREGGGDLTQADLDAFRVIWRQPVRATFRGHEFLSNPPPSSGAVLIAYGLAILERLGDTRQGSAEAIATIAEVMREQTRARGGSFASELHRGGLASRLLADSEIAAAISRITERAPAVTEHAPYGGTTHVSVIDGDGNAASLSTSTGSGSGVIIPGTGIYMNNMLGEYDLVVGHTPRPGRRLTSMMSPSVALDPSGRTRLVVGSAGSARLRGAIMQIVVNVIQHGMGVEDAIAAPRVHVDEPHLHCEGGHDQAELDRLEEQGYDVVRWRRRNLFFGGAAGVEVRADGTLAAAGDPRRGGAGFVVSA